MNCALSRYAKVFPKNLVTFPSTPPVVWPSSPPVSLAFWTRPVVSPPAVVVCWIRKISG
jgi:hypothetical protein